jgi:hypothetical protein
MDCGCDARRAWVRRQLVRADARAEQLTDHQVTAITFGVLAVVGAVCGWLLLRDMGEERTDGGNQVQH